MELAALCRLEMRPLRNHSDETKQMRETYRSEEALKDKDRKRLRILLANRGWPNANLFALVVSIVNNAIERSRKQAKKGQRRS
jgi:hypothetical protein